MWKECTHCHKRQPLVNFSKHHQRTSGHLYSEDNIQGIEGGDEPFDEDIVILTRSAVCKGCDARRQRISRHTATPKDVADEAELLAPRLLWRSR